MSFKTGVSLLVFRQNDLFIDQTGVLRSPTITEVLFFSLYLPYVFACVHAQSLQSCPTLCDPMDYSPQVSSVHGTLQAREKEWVAMPSSRGSS